MENSILSGFLTLLLLIAAAAIWVLARRLRKLQTRLGEKLKDRAPAEELLARSMDLLGSAIHNSPAGIFLKNLEGRYIFANASFERLFSIGMTDCTGKTDQEVFPLEFARRLRANDRTVLEGGKPMLWEEAVPRDDGLHTYLVSKAPMRDRTGAVGGIAGIAIDVSPARQAEQELRDSRDMFDQLFNQGWDATFLLEGEAVTDCNGEALEVFRCAREALLGQPLFGLSPETQPGGASSRDKAREMVREALGGNPQAFRWRFAAADGTPLDAEVNLRAIKRYGAQRLLAIVRDVTRQMTAERELHRLNAQLRAIVDERTRQLQERVQEGDLLNRALLNVMEDLRLANAKIGRTVEQLQASNRELEAFSYAVSHDLRAPLRIIEGFSRALLEDQGGRLDAAGLDHLERIGAAVGRLQLMIRALLEMSRLASREFSRERVDLGALAREITAELQASAPLRKVHFEIPDHLAASGDPQLLRVALQNLLANAWKFTRKMPEAVIEVGSRQEGGETVYYVADNGAGFDAAHARMLFGAFQRFHRGEDYEGMGIGLATVRRVIHRHGGRVWAQAAKGEGAALFFTLPGKDETYEEVDRGNPNPDHRGLRR